MDIYYITKNGRYAVTSHPLLDIWQVYDVEFGVPTQQWVWSGVSCDTWREAIDRAERLP